MTSRVLRTSDGRYAGTLPNPAAPPTLQPAPTPPADPEQPSAHDELTDTYQRYLARTWTPTQDVIDLYTDSDCWLLARHLHAQTGWPYAAIIDAALDADGTLVHDVADAVTVAWFHVGVLTPDGGFLDVTGIHRRDDALNAWADRADPDSGWGGDVDMVTFDCDTYHQMLSLPADGTDGNPDQNSLGSWEARHGNAASTATARLDTSIAGQTRACPRCTP